MGGRFKEEIDQPKNEGRSLGSEDGATFFSASDLHAEPVPERLWLVERFIPQGQPTLLSGDGGTGKSTLVLQLCVSVVLQRPWLGLQVKAGSALYISAEDDRDEVHRRLASIAISYGASLGDMKNLVIRCLAGEDAVIPAPDKKGKMIATSLFDEITKVVGVLKPVVVVLDSLADMFAGNENDRAQVRQFVGMLRRLAIRNTCSVVILAHPSLTGLASGTGLSGSTAWNNSVRSRLYFSRESGQVSGEIGDTDARTLEVKKANYGAIGESVCCRWVDGVFVAESHTRIDLVSRVAAQNRADQTFVSLLNRLSGQGRQVSDAPGRNYAPNLFAKQANNDGITRQGFTAAMNRLFDAGRITVAFEGPPSKQRRFLKVSEGAE